MAYTGEIRMFACNYEPVGWLACNGQLLPTAKSPLFAVIRNVYGGNGTSNFKLPNLAGAAAIHQGSGYGLSKRKIGDTGGAATVMLTLNQLPAHGHQPGCVTSGNSVSPLGNVWATAGSVRPAPNFYARDMGSPKPMAAYVFGNVGGGQPHDNLMPYLGLNFCICLNDRQP